MSVNFGLQPGYQSFQPDAMSGIKQRLENSPLNASRVVELGKSVHGTEGQPIGVTPDRLVSLRTGNPVLDQANATASKVSKFGLKSALDVSTATAKGGLYGSIVGALVGLFLFIAGPKTGKRLAVLVGASYLLGGMMGAAMRGIQAFKKNMNTGVELVRNDVIGKFQ